MELRWIGADINRIPVLTQELVGLQPDIVTNTTPATVALQRETWTMAIVFVNVGDSRRQRHGRAARPAEWEHHRLRNSEASMGGKWVEPLSEIAPALKRAVGMFNPGTAPVTALQLPAWHRRLTQSVDS